MTHVTLYSVHEIALRCGVDEHFVDQLVALGVIETQAGPERAFPGEASLRIGKFLRLQRDLGINSEGAALVIELLDRIEALEARLRHLEGR